MVESKVMITEMQYKNALNIIKNYWQEKRNNTTLFESELFESQETVRLDAIFRSNAASAIVNCYQQTSGINANPMNTIKSFKIADLQKLDADNLNRYRGFGSFSRDTLDKLLEKYEFEKAI